MNEETTKTITPQEICVLVCYVLTFDEVDGERLQRQEFVAWFAAPPAVDQIVRLGFSPDYAKHIASGGGRQAQEYCWYRLGCAVEGWNHEVGGYPLAPITSFGQTARILVDIG